MVNKPSLGDSSTPVYSTAKTVASASGTPTLTNSSSASTDVSQVFPSIGYDINVMGTQVSALNNFATGAAQAIMQACNVT